MLGTNCCLVEITQLLLDFAFTFFYSYVELQVYSLPTDRIYATYFGGDEKAGLPPDNEARDIWLKFLPPGHVLPFGCKVCSSLSLLIFPF